MFTNVRVVTKESRYDFSILLSTLGECNDDFHTPTRLYTHHHARQDGVGSPTFRKIKRKFARIWPLCSDQSCKMLLTGGVVNVMLNVTHGIDDVSCSIPTCAYCCRGRSVNF